MRNPNSSASREIIHSVQKLVEQMHPLSQWMRGGPAGQHSRADCSMTNGIVDCLRLLQTELDTLCQQDGVLSLVKALPAEGSSAPPSESEGGAQRPQKKLQNTKMRRVAHGRKPVNGKRQTRRRHRQSSDESSEEEELGTEEDPSDVE
jgi:hypothetical protein